MNQNLPPTGKDSSPWHRIAHHSLEIAAALHDSTKQPEPTVSTEPVAQAAPATSSRRLLLGVVLVAGVALNLLNPRIWRAETWQATPSPAASVPAHTVVRTCSTTVMTETVSTKGTERTTQTRQEPCAADTDAGNSSATRLAGHAAKLGLLGLLDLL